MGKIRLPKSSIRHRFSVDTAGKKKWFTFVPSYPISKLKTYDRNPRLNENAVAPVAKSIQQFGFNQPILLGPDGTICAGHTRYKSAQEIGLENVPVIIAEDLIGNAFVGYNVADNQTAQIAQWDDDLLQTIIAELQADMGDDIVALGFDPKTLNDLLTDIDPSGFEPGLLADQSSIDRKNPVTCPKCGHTWEPGHEK